jgi:hypothetical protein
MLATFLERKRALNRATTSRALPFPHPPGLAGMGGAGRGPQAARDPANDGTGKVLACHSAEKRCTIFDWRNRVIRALEIALTTVPYPL